MMHGVQEEIMDFQLLLRKKLPLQPITTLFLYQHQVLQKYMVCLQVMARLIQSQHMITVSY